jgi:hypothetical protein
MQKSPDEEALAGLAGAYALAAPNEGTHSDVFTTRFLWPMLSQLNLCTRSIRAKHSDRSSYNSPSSLRGILLKKRIK